MINNIKKHLFSTIAFGLSILAFILFFVPFVSFSGSENGTVGSGMVSGFELAFGINFYISYATGGNVNRQFNELDLSAVSMVALVFLIVGFFALLYLLLKDRHQIIIFFISGFFFISGLLSFLIVPASNFDSIRGLIPVHPSLTAGAIIYGLIMIAATVLLLLDYFVKPKDAVTSVKTKQELVDNDIMVSVRHLKQFFPMGQKGKIKAVHDVSFDIKKGECFGVVGESGCGKTTTGRSIIRLYDITSGSIYFKGVRISAGSRWNEKEIKWTKVRAKNKIRELRENMKAEIDEMDSNSLEGKAKIAETKKRYEAEIKEIRDQVKEVVKFQNHKIAQIKYDNAHVDPKLMSKMQMIFQDPIDSLDPRMTVEEIIAEGLKIQGHRNKEENHKKVCEVLEEVGLIPDYCSRYPNEFSGGQRQRIAIARAVVMNPDFMICDEPISALDVSIRAQIINLLNSLKENHGLTLMFIAHDLSVVKYFCDRIAVMYYGEIVELASSDELFAHPLHPYTRALLSAIPKPDPLSEQKRQRIVYNPKKEHDYTKEEPELQEIVPGHFILANTEEMEKYRVRIREEDEENARKAEEEKELGSY